MHARFEQTNGYTNKCSNGDADKNKCYGGFARVAHLVREYRTKAEKKEIPPVLYLNAGDTYTGTPWFTLYKDNITAAFLDLLKPDAISLGNHEFDEGPENLDKFLNEINFPVLAANVDVSKETGIKSNRLKNSEIFEKNGVKIGIIGYLTPETKGLARPNNVEYTDEIMAINSETQKLKNQGVNILIALGHSGLTRDKEIAAGCPDIDLVIGGHSHTFLFTGDQPDIEKPEDVYPVMVTQKNGRKVPVVQAFAYTKYLGFLDLEFDKNGELVHINGAPKLLNGEISRDPDFLKLLDVYRPGITKWESEIVGSSKVFLNGSCRLNECNLGNFIADSMVYWNAINYQSNDSWTDAAIALIQGGGIRTSIDQKQNGGNISMSDASTILPFGNNVVIVEVTGKDILEALEHSVHRYNIQESYGEFLQFSGLHVTYNLSNPVGSRVKEAEVLCANCLNPTFSPINETHKYKILMQSFVAIGGDGYSMFKDKQVKDLQESDLNIFLLYLKKKSPIYPAVEWRITFDSSSTSPGGSSTLRISIIMPLIFAIFSSHFKLLNI
jgi:5'-nucleotidase